MTTAGCSRGHLGDILAPGFHSLLAAPRDELSSSLLLIGSVTCSWPVWKGLCRQHLPAVPASARCRDLAGQKHSHGASRGGGTWLSICILIPGSFCSCWAWRGMCRDREGLQGSAPEQRDALHPVARVTKLQEAERVPEALTGRSASTENALPAKQALSYNRTCSDVQGLQIQD